MFSFLGYVLNETTYIRLSSTQKKKYKQPRHMSILQNNNSQCRPKRHSQFYMKRNNSGVENDFFSSAKERRTNAIFFQTFHAAIVIFIN